MQLRYQLLVIATYLLGVATWAAYGEDDLLPPPGLAEEDARAKEINLLVSLQTEAEYHHSAGTLDQSLDELLFDSLPSTSLLVRHQHHHYQQQIVSTERVSWAMAKTALRKHKAKFYSQQEEYALRESSWMDASRPSSTSSRDGKAGHNVLEQSDSSPLNFEQEKGNNAVPPPSTLRPGPFLPLDHLMNHLVNTKSSVLLALWQFTSHVRPYLLGSATKSTEATATGPAKSTITALLSCFDFDSNTKKLNSEDSPLPPQAYIGSSQLTQSTQTTLMWEMVKDTAALGLHLCTSQNAKNDREAAPSASSKATTCAVQKASEILYWVTRGEDYSLGRGRVIQSRVFIDILHEEVGGEAAPYWLATPRRVASPMRGSYQHSAPAARRMHPQVVAFRPVDGFDFMVDVSSNGAPEIEAIKAFVDNNKVRNGDGSQLRLPSEGLVFFPEVAVNVKPFILQLIMFADSNEGKLPSGHKTANAALRFIFQMRRTATPFPDGNDREGGKRMLIEYFANQWSSLSSGKWLVAGTAIDPVPYCAPIILTSPRIFAVREKQDRSGKDTYLEFLTGPDNRGRQIPIGIEDTWVFEEDLQQAPEDWDSVISSPSAISDPTRIVPLLRKSRRGLLAKLDPFASAFSIPQISKRKVVVSGDYDFYRPYMDPTSPSYRRILCATYTYHKKTERALVLHKTSSHLCDKHLIFTDQPVSPNILQQLDQDRYVVIALNTPGGEDYRNMWAKTRMILSRLEMLANGFEERTPEEGANDPHRETRSPADQSPSSPPRSAAMADGDQNFDVEAIAKSLLPHYSGYDHVMLSGDDVCMNILKLRKYLAEVDEMYGVAMPTYQPTVSSGSISLQLTQNSNAYCGKGGQYGFYRSPTTPHHIGFAHRHFISGATYIMNIHAYHTFMKASFHTCNAKMRTFAEDVLIAGCHSNTGVRGRNAANEYGEDLFNSVGIESITGQTHKVSNSWWLHQYRRKAWGRSGVVTGRDSIEHHFCPESEMKRWVSDAFGVNL